MLLQPLLNGDFQGFLITLCLMVPAVIICLTVHECAHGLVARLLGDRTAQRAGRLTLDPMAHIDPVGFLCMMFLGFGWARPVPVNVTGFKIKNRKVGMALVGLAGPLSNFILAIPCYMLAIVLSTRSGSSNFITTLVLFFQYIATLSVGLGVFNLIPVHPLDGSRILDAFIPLRIQMRMQQYQPIILLAVIAIVYFGLFDIVILRANQMVLQFAVKLVAPFFL